MRVDRQTDRQTNKHIFRTPPEGEVMSVNKSHLVVDKLMSDVHGDIQ